MAVVGAVAVISCSEEGPSEVESQLARFAPQFQVNCWEAENLICRAPTAGEADDIQAALDRIRANGCGWISDAVEWTMGSSQLFVYTEDDGWAGWTYDNSSIDLNYLNWNQNNGEPMESFDHTIAHEGYHDYHVDTYGTLGSNVDAEYWADQCTGGDGGI